MSITINLEMQMIIRTRLFRTEQKCNLLTLNIVKESFHIMEVKSAVQKINKIDQCYRLFTHSKDLKFTY